MFISIHITLLEIVLILVLVTPGGERVRYDAQHAIQFGLSLL